MGDRANIVIREDWPNDLHAKEAVFLYSHWGGHELPEILRLALARRERWTDGQYLARIVFDTMIGDQQGEETGFGIGTRLGDNSYPLLVLRPSEQRIVVLSEETYGTVGFDATVPGASYVADGEISFEDYIAKPRTWHNLTS